MCGQDLSLYDQSPRRWACHRGHSFDVARHGYVNLLPTGRRRGEPGDTKEMVAARRRFLDSGAYDPISETLVRAVAAVSGDAGLIVDIGCGVGYYTRRLAPTSTGSGAGADEAGMTVARPAIDVAGRSVARAAADVAGVDVARAAVDVAGVDVARWAVDLAARSDPAGLYAVASAADLPLADGAVDVAVLVFGPVFPAELARVVRPGGAVVAVHPGPRHLESVRALVYPDPRPHEVKPPLRMAGDEFAKGGAETVTFPVVVHDPALLRALFTMTPYRWHAPHDIAARLDGAAAAGFETQSDVVVTTYVRR